MPENPGDQLVPATPAAALYQARDLVRDFRRQGSGGAMVRAVDGISLDLMPAQRLGIVGESGSGKSTLVRMLDGLLAPTSGQLDFEGRSILGRNAPGLDQVRAKVAMIFQDPRSSLDPRMKVAQIVTEPLRSPVHRVHASRRAAAQARAQRLAEVLTQVGLEPDAASRYPHEFSGGQRQRIAIARAIVARPQVLIADEAVSALDVSVRAHVLNLLNQLVADGGLSLIFVSHDLSVVRLVCDSVLVMRAGQVVESGPVAQVYGDPQQAYTRELLAAVPRIRAHRQGTRVDPAD